MKTKIVHEGNEGTLPALREFRFIDQTDQSPDAATAYQAVVRSHVMTEIRRERRSKAKLHREVGSKVMASASEWSGINSYRTRGGTHQLPPGRSDSTSWQNQPSTLDQIPEAATLFAEPSPDQLMGSVEWNPPGKIICAGDPDFQYPYDLQAVHSTKSWFNDIPSPNLEMHAFNLDRACVESACSEAVVVHTGAEKHVPKRCYCSARTGGVQPECSRATILSPTILGRSRVDPFRPLPIPADRDVYQLVDHYTVTIPFLMYGTRSRNPVQHQLYNVATQDPAAFHALLAYSARHSDSIRNSQKSKRAIGHSSRTLRLVYERIREPSFKCEDGLVMAVALLAFAERRFGQSTIAQQHWLALREILKSRGGIETLQLNRWLAATLYWNCLVWSGTSDHTTEATFEWASLIATNEPADGPSTSAEFTRFFANLASSNSRLLGHIESGCTAPCSYSCLRRRAVFALNGPLCKLVAPTRFGKDSDDRVVAANNQRTARACQLPCLLYLNIVMAEYEASPELVEHFLEKLMVCIFEESLDMDVSAEHLLIKLLNGVEESKTELTHRAHQTVRMASVIQKLDFKSQQSFRGALLEALVLPEIDTEFALDDRSLIARAELPSGSLTQFGLDYVDASIIAQGLPLHSENG